LTFNIIFFQLCWNHFFIW